ncbi:MAG: DUF1732 domain-containing protein [Candidatus Omnitrophota bacterium]|nr:MAG: DUF1732 domain-containing protein [Candidatus Omnitrophota bacterium]
MAMKSMTAYASIYKRKDAQAIQLVLRSLNFKYLDISIHNLGAENVLLEEKIKREVKKRIPRGKIEVHVFLKRPAQGQIHIEEKVLDKYVSQLKRLSKKYNLTSQMNLAQVLQLPHVVWGEEEKGGYETIVLAALKDGLNRLEEFKKKEGKVIKNEMLKNLKRLKGNIGQVKKHKPPPQKTENNNKEDIDEEVSLISFYINKLESKISSSKAEPKGKAMDFLTQEILRELNSASSKTKRKIVSSLIVESKTYLERIREQAQNIE